MNQNVIIGTGLAVLLMLTGLPAAAALFGTENTTNSAPARSELPDGVYHAGGADFQVSDGQIRPVQNLRRADPGSYTLVAGQVRETLEIRARHLCVTGRDELAAAIALPPEQLGGLTVCLNPGFYEMRNRDYRDRFHGLSEPAVFTSADLEDRAVLNHWWMGSKEFRTGNVTLRSLDFRISRPEVPIGENGFIGRHFAIAFGKGRFSHDITIDDVHITGNLREARLGGRETDRLLIGVDGTGSNIVIRNSEFRRIAHAISIAGENILVEHNRGHQNWGDLIQVFGQGNRQSCRKSRDITLRNNITADSWSNFRIHPDVIHIYPPYGMHCGVENLLIEGTIAYLGETAYQPAYPTNQENMVPIQAPARLPDAGKRLWRLIGPGTVELPPASCPNRHTEMGIQLQPGSAPITIRPAPGQELRYGTRKRVDQFTLLADWETWRVFCPGRGADRWELRQSIPYIQGIFSNNIPGDGTFTNVTVRNNILWSNAPRGITFSDPEQSEIKIHNNSLLQIFPGDIDGDGRANTTADGFNEFFTGPRIFIGTPQNTQVWRNISAPLNSIRDPQILRFNDHRLRHDDNARSMLQRFRPTGSGGVFFPRSPREALEFARPRPGGLLENRAMGAVATHPDDDWYDWSWVPDS